MFQMFTRIPSCGAGLYGLALRSVLPRVALASTGSPSTLAPLSCGVGLYGFGSRYRVVLASTGSPSDRSSLVWRWPLRARPPLGPPSRGASLYGLALRPRSSLV